LFPLPEENDIETRIAAVAGLSGQGADGTLMQPLRKTILFPRPEGSPFSLWQYQAALELSTISDPDRRAQRMQAGVVPFDEVEKEARLAGPAHWSSQRDAITKALEAWKEMERALDEKAGSASPSGNRVRELLESLLEIANKFAPAPDASAELAAESGTTSATPAARTTSGPITGREQALRQLGEVAAWFKLNEPNSPVGFTLDEAVRRARLPWPDLVEELVSDETARQALLTSVGIKRSTPPAEQ
jgi:type VI secretion system protein ImpA